MRSIGATFSNVRSLASIVSASLALLFWATYSGPYAWLAELQLRIWGQYFTFLTYILLLLLFLLILHGGIRFFTWLSGSPATVSAANRQMLALGAGSSEPPVLRRADSKARRLAATFLVTALGAIGFGAWEFAEGVRAGKLRSVNVQEFETNEAPKATWIDVSGRLLKNSDISLTEQGGGRTRSTTHYFPLVSEAWKNGMPVAVFIEVADYQVSRLDSNGPFRGMVRWTRLPGAVRSGFINAQLVPTDSHIVLEMGRTPESKEGLGEVFATIGGVLAALAFVTWQFGDRIARWNARKPPRGKPPMLFNMPSAVRGRGEKGGRGK
jgi:hypothetical protein